MIPLNNRQLEDDYSSLMENWKTIKGDQELNNTNCIFIYRVFQTTMAHMGIN